MRAMLLLLGVLLYSACDLKNPLGEYGIQDCTPDKPLKEDDCNVLNMGKSPMECRVYQCDRNRRCVLGPRDADRDGDPAMGCGEGRDCDDTDPNRSSQRPEICDGIDNNCDGSIDNDRDKNCTCIVDTVVDCAPDPSWGMNYNNSTSICKTGTRKCVSAQKNTKSYYPTNCDGRVEKKEKDQCDNMLDHDCDGKFATGFPVTWYDEDKDKAEVIANHGERCVAGYGACRRSGKVWCATDPKNPQGPKTAQCSVTPGSPPMDVNIWHAQPYQDIINNPPFKATWDWNCDGVVNTGGCNVANYGTICDGPMVYQFSEHNLCTDNCTKFDNPMTCAGYLLLSDVCTERNCGSPPPVGQPGFNIRPWGCMWSGTGCVPDRSGTGTYPYRIFCQ